MIKTIFRDEHFKDYLSYFTNIFLLASIYYFAGKFSFFLAQENSIVSITFFPAEGFALVAAIIWGTKILPGIFIGQFVLAISSGLDFTPTLEISLINTIEAYLGYFLFNKYLDKKLLRTRDIIGLLMLILFVLQIFSSTLGNLALLSNSVITDKEFTTSLFSWWFGNSMGQILFTPALLLLYSNYKKTNYLKLFTIVIGVILINYSIFFY